MKILKKVVLCTVVLSMLLSMAALPALADSHEVAWGAATVDATALNIRSGPGLDYERVGCVSDGTVVVILEKTSDEWYKVNYLGTVGYVSVEYLKDIVTVKNFKATGVVTGDDVRMRSGPSTDDEVMTSYNTGLSVSIIGINEGWYKIVTDDGTGYMRSDYIDITGGGPVYTSEISTDSEASSDLGQQIANYALQYEGYKYVYGEESPSKGFDCSGFTYYVYSQFGYKLERRASLQCKNNGKSVSRDDLQKGDLVFFSDNGSYATHVGIYIGNGQYIHASNSKTGVIISTLKTYFAARRVI